MCEGLHKPVDHDQYLYTKRVQCQAQLDILVHTIYVDVMIPNMEGVPKKSHLKNKAMMIDALKMAIMKYKEGKSVRDNSHLEKQRKAAIIA